jgi:hypothetical protein
LADITKLSRKLEQAHFRFDDFLCLSHGRSLQVGSSRTNTGEDQQLSDQIGASTDQALAWLVDEGAAVSEALIALLAGLEGEGPAVLVVDMVEQGLDHPTQEALIAHLRQRANAGARPLFLMTRSTAILDLAAIGPNEAILFCPANHSSPTRVAPYPGAPGYEGVATCLASPEVRARTAGMVAWRARSPADHAPDSPQRDVIIARETGSPFTGGKAGGGLR